MRVRIIKIHSAFCMSLFCCDFFRTCNFIISDIFRMSIVIFAFFSEI
nr:MAG TPA: hypothetical protein [Caudoviricetes sp.]